MGKHRNSKGLSALGGVVMLLGGCLIVAAPAQADGFGLLLAQSNMGQYFTDAQQIIALNRLAAFNAPTDAKGPYIMTYSAEVAARLGLQTGGVSLVNLPSRHGNGFGVSFGAGGQPGMRGPMLNLRWRFGR